MIQSRPLLCSVWQGLTLPMTRDAGVTWPPTWRGSLEVLVGDGGGRSLILKIKMLKDLGECLIVFIVISSSILVSLRLSRICILLSVLLK